MLNPLISRDYIQIIITDCVKRSQYEELEGIYEAINPDILITDKSVNVPNYNLNTPDIIEIDNLYICNNKNINDIKNSNHKIINVSDNINAIGHLICLVGPNFESTVSKENTWFGKINGTSCVLCGGQPSESLLSWALLLINKKTYDINWGFHSLLWSVLPQEHEACQHPKYNKKTIFTPLYT